MRSRFVVALTLYLAAATGAHAQLVSGSAGGSFANLSSCDSSGGDRDCRIVSTVHGAATQVQWGSQHPTTDFVNPSKLTSVDVGFDSYVPAMGITIGQLDWYNSATLRLNSSLDVFAVTWALAVTFDSPSGSDPYGQELFRLSIRNPINPTGDRIYGFELADLSNLASSITLDGVTLSNFRYQVTDGIGVGTSWLTNNWWYNDEYNHSSLTILADAQPITSPIPEPQAYMMLLAGLILLGFNARRKSASSVRIGMPKAA